MGDGVGEGGATGNDTTFAGTFDTKGIQGRRGVLRDDALHRWNLHAGRQRIVQQGGGEKLTVFIINKLLQQCAADALGSGPHSLAVHQQRVNSTAHVFQHEVPQDLYQTSLGVHYQVNQVTSGTATTRIASGPATARSAAGR